MADFNQIESLPNVPPPPPEVKIRTLKSDLESMAKSGGTAPQYQNIKAPSLMGLGAEEKKVVADQSPKPKDRLILVVVGIAATLIVAAIGYFAYKLFFQSGVARQSNAPVAAVPPPTTPAPAPVPAPAIGTSAGFAHRSLFRKPPDKLLTLTMSGNNASGATDLRTYTQQLRGLLNAEAASAFFEVNVKGFDGHDFGVNEVFSAAGLDVLDPQFVSQHFGPDLTVFMYRDKNGSWPGYVLALKTGENWLFLRNDVAQLEKSSKVQSFFLANVGTPASQGFSDVVEGGQPARVLKFDSGASFTYGWFKGYLVLSTSEDGLKEALARL